VSDRPAHILEIPDSLGRDVDAYRAGKLKEAPPVEAFMSEESVQQVWDSSQAPPVHAEDLVPITRDEAVQRTTFDGENLPRLPSTRRVIPAPFRRERVSLDRHGRTWQTCRAETVQAGDMVAGLGRVRETETVTRYETVSGVPGVAVGVKVIITGIAGNRAVYEPGQDVRAFRLAG
jgi:hypothetical protein